MNQLKHVSFILAAALALAIPVAAQKTQHSNTGAGKTQGQARTAEVHGTNPQSNARTPSKGSKSKGKKTQTREGWEKNAKHRGTNK